MPAGRRRKTAVTSVPPLVGLAVKPGAVAAILAGTPDPPPPAAREVAEMATYLVLSSFTGQPVKRFAAKPQTRLPVPTARRRMLPSQPISVITTLTVASARAGAPARVVSCSRMSAARCSRMPVTHCELCRSPSALAGTRNADYAHKMNSYRWQC
jgi:hypothetical protein